MYTEEKFPTRILIVKTSSLGDIIQAFIILGYLKSLYPNVLIDWAVEASFAPIVSAHPLVFQTIALHIKEKKDLWKGVKLLRKEKYDLIFDLQANCKSGVITWLARGKTKVGYGLQSVREWPNIFATNRRFNVSKEQNIRLFYLGLIEKCFGSPPAPVIDGVRFVIEEGEREKVQKIVEKAPNFPKIMVCPGSKWVNKQLEIKTLTAFLQKIETFYSASFFLIWGDEVEKQQCLEVSASLQRGFVIEKLLLPTWQNLMNEMDLIIAIDSSALHLSATTLTPSFSIFGPTSSHIFKPTGERHVAFQGTCPYGRVFIKQCPILRSCPTGACIRDLKAEELFQAFQNQCAFLRSRSLLRF